MQYKKSLKILGRAMVSLVLTFVFFRTNFDEKYNACVIAIVFILYEVGISYLCKRRELIKKRGLVTAAICGIVLSITTLIGSFVENEQMFTIGVKSVLFLVAHTILLGILSLCLFIKLEEVNCLSRNKEFEEIFLNKYGGVKREYGVYLRYAGCRIALCIFQHDLVAEALIRSCSFTGRKLWHEICLPLYMKTIMLQITIPYC